MKALENFCRQLGAEKFFLQSDPEPSIQDDMHVLGTRQGIVKARSVKRTIQSERYDQQLLLQMKGRPYDIRGDKVIEEPPTVQITPGLRSSSSSAEPMASSEPATATTPAVSSDVPEKADTNQMDVEQQNTERRQDGTKPWR